MPHFRGWRHFYCHFPLVLLGNSSLPSILQCGVWPSELCVITQLETISLLHICCQGSAKNGTTVSLGDLTSSHGAAELPTPTGRKSNTSRLRDDWTNECLCPLSRTHLTDITSTDSVAPAAVLPLPCAVMCSVWGRLQMTSYPILELFQWLY